MIVVFEISSMVDKDGATCKLLVTMFLAKGFRSSSKGGRHVLVTGNTLTWFENIFAELSFVNNDRSLGFWLS